MMSNLFTDCPCPKLILVPMTARSACFLCHLCFKARFDCVSRFP
uniref:Uncharacterized protein n=1 Tax=Rhizophora mucronata TaxID=61149 RepID=A0A2P2IVP3_RHIMU